VPSIQNSYIALFSDIKQRIQAARSRAALAVNAELIRLYWDIGRTLLVRREKEAGGERWSIGWPLISRGHSRE